MKEYFIFTIFPEIIECYKRIGILKQAEKKGLARVVAVNLREYAEGGMVDDVPYGGHPGMVLKPEPVFLAYEDVKKGGKPFLIATEPYGKKLNQSLAKEILRYDRVVILCGRYEGIDHRVKSIVDLEVSVGDVVLSGGELPALMIAESVIRLIPGVLGEPESLKRDSFSGRWLGCPVYTRPREFRGMEVPAELLSGNHELIKLWELFHSIKNTLEKRPSMIPKDLTDTEKTMIEVIKKGGDFGEWRKRHGGRVKTSS
jgi:tRNA (guanine37-N1)-methyltransferase